MVSCIATVGNVGITSEESFTNQQINSLIPNSNTADFKYLYYFFKANKSYLESLGGGGSVYTNISKNKFEKMEVIVPPIVEQKQIAEILSSLDDKIELNRAINANLEKLASSLFKKWFVDIGDELPEGWKTELMTNFVEIDKGLSYKGSDLNANGEDALVGLKCFERGGGFRTDGIKRFSGEFKQQQLLNPGDLILAMTDLTQGAEVLGKPAIVPNIKNVKHLVASLDISILRPKYEIISKAFLYLFFKRQETQDYLFGFSNGSTVLHLSIEGLRKIKIIVPPYEKMQEFNNLIRPIFDHMQILNNEKQVLEDIRNSLLPRLMSGKIRV